MQRYKIDYAARQFSILNRNKSLTRYKVYCTIIINKWLLGNNYCKRLHNNRHFFMYCIKLLFLRFNFKGDSYEKSG